METTVASGCNAANVSLRIVCTVCSLIVAGQDHKIINPEVVIDLGLL